MRECRISIKRKAPKITVLFFIILFTALFVAINNLKFLNQEIIVPNKEEINETKIDSLNIDDVKTREDILTFKDYDMAGTTNIIYDEHDIILIGVSSLGSIFLLEIATISKKLRKNSHENKLDTNTFLHQKVEGITATENIVYGFVKDYLNQNRYFEKEKLLKFLAGRISREKINLNGIGISIVLDTLLNKNLVAEGSKLNKTEILSNGNREMIYDFVRENPGVYVNIIVKNLNLSTFLVNWHLEMLLKFNLIRKTKIGNYDAYFDINSNSKQDEILHIFSREKCSKLIRYLEINREGANKNRISKDLAMHPNTVTKYLNDLEKYGLLITELHSRSVIYYLNENEYSIYRN